MSAVQWPWPSDRIHELEAENERLRGTVERLEIEKHDLAERLAEIELIEEQLKVLET